jgi:hypothetical protein
VTALVIFGREIAPLIRTHVKKLVADFSLARVYPFLFLPASGSARISQPTLQFRQPIPANPRDKRNFSKAPRQKRLKLMRSGFK